WSGADLEGALRVQLAEDYLKPEYRRHGVLVVTHHRDRRWLRTNESEKIEFSDLIAWLSGISATIKQNAAGYVAVECVGLNAWRPAATPATPKQLAPRAKAPVKRGAVVEKVGRKKIKKAHSKRQHPKRSRSGRKRTTAD